MKHLKKLSVVLMLTALFSVTFTSCIDNEVSPVVEAIYEAQADLIAAQAGVQNAEAAYLLARAEAEQAQAAWTTAQAAQVDAITAGIEETNSYNALSNDQAILLLVAQTNRDVAAAENAMALAQVAFEAAMQTAIAAMEAAGAQIAVGYAWDYANAMNHANYLMSQLLGAQGDLADAQLMLTGIAGSEVSYAYHLAQLQNAVSVKESEIAVAEANLATLEAHAADPIAAKEILEAQKTTLKAQYEDLLQQEVAQQNVIDALNFEVGDRNITVSQLASALNDHNISLTTRITREGLIATAEDNIAGWEADLADYPTALAALELAVSDAQDAVTAAEDALDAANTAKWAADDVLADADADLLAAENSLIALNTELSALNGSYQDAIQDLADETVLYEAGLPAAEAALIAAEATLAAAEADVLVAQADYDAKVVAFEANPTGFVWTGGLNGAVGIHLDATTATNSYRNYDDTLNTMSALSLANNGGTDETGNYATYAAYALDAPSLGYDSFYNVGGDDVAGGTNADRLELAADVLTLALDAIAPLEAAVAVEQDIVDNFGDALAAAQLVYDHQKDLYENQLALVATAQAVVDAADAAQVAAAADLVIKIQAVTDASTDLTDANTDLTSAEGDLTAFLVCDDACIQSNIDAALANIALWTEQITNIQVFIDAKYAVVSGLLGVLTADGVEWTFEVDEDGYGTFNVTNDTVLGASYSDLRAELIAASQVLWTIQRDIAAVQSERTAVNDLLSQWNTSYNTFVNTTIPGLKSSLVLLETGLEQALAALALATNAETAAEANIAYLEALIDTLEARHANTLVIAAKYKALMEAALAS